VRFARRERISDDDLCRAVERAERGLVDADLGGGVIKQRIARRNHGLSSGFRTIVFFRSKGRAFFVFGFAKNTMDNISESSAQAFELVANTVLNHDEKELKALLDSGLFLEVLCGEENLQ